jgi:hypothetical protein
VNDTAYAALAAIASDPDAARLDELITLTQAAAEQPCRRAGKKMSVQCVYRWTGPRGCRGIRLNFTQCGATRCTTRRWLAEFYAALAAQSRGEATAAAPATSAPPLASRSPAARARAIAKADAELAKLAV